MTTHCFDCGKVFKMDEDPIQFNGDHVCDGCCEKRATGILQTSVKSMLFAARKLARVNREKWTPFVKAAEEMHREVN